MQQVQSGEVYAIEYYHAALDHYFISASAADIDALDCGRFPGWTRTGRAAPRGRRQDAVFGARPARVPFLHPAGQGDSHFFSASTEECEAARDRHPGAIVESAAAFYTALPDPLTGNCGMGKWPGTNFWVHACPVYRLWNGRVDSNHRYTQNSGVRAQMVSRGYTSEGYGPMGVAMCVLVWALWEDLCY